MVIPTGSEQVGVREGGREGGEMGEKTVSGRVGRGGDGRGGEGRGLSG